MAGPSEFIGAVVIFLAVMDPFVGLMALFAISKSESSKGKIENANKALIVAASVVTVFMLFGIGILTVFKISLFSFEIAGGIVLMLLGLQTVLGFNLGTKNLQEKDAEAVLIGTPIIAGPGTILTVILLSQELGQIVAMAAAVTALAITWIILRVGIQYESKIPQSVVRIMSGLLGLFITAFAVEFIVAGIRGYFA